METRTSLSEVLNRKKDFKRDLIEKGFHEEVEALVENIEAEVKTYVFDFNFRDYQKGELKRRAQTISVAYNIATKLMLSLSLTGTTETYFKSHPYSLHRDKLEELKTGDLNDFVYNVMLQAVTEVDMLTYKFRDFKTDRAVYRELTHTLSSLSVTLAWLEVWYKTGFMPRDIQVVDIEHEVHKGLTHEVYILLQRTEESMLGLMPFLNHQPAIRTLEFDKEITSPDFEILGTANILVNGTMLIEIKTTGKQPDEDQVKRDFKHAVGLNRLDENIKHLFIYYARFNFLARADINE